MERVTDYVQTNKRIVRGIDDRSAIAIGRAIDISTRALSMGMTRDRVVAIWRARGVGFVLSDALVPGVGR